MTFNWHLRLGKPNYNTWNGHVVENTDPKHTMTCAIWNSSKNLLTVVPQGHGDVGGHTIIPVVDLSVSMSAPVSIRAGKDVDKEMTQYTTLDLVKYSLKVVLNALTERDKFGLVTFSDDARVVREPAFVENTQDVMDQIDDMGVDGMTNLWAGLKTALDVARGQENVTILLFTDGVANLHPPSGYDIAFERNTIDFNQVSTHVFAYGTSNMDQDLLFKTSVAYNGTFNYISDASMIGTVFVNTMANVMSQYVKSIRIAGVSMGQLNYGQFRHYILAERPNEIYVGNKLLRVVDRDGYGDDVYNFHYSRVVMREAFNAFFKGNALITDKLLAFKEIIGRIDWTVVPELEADLNGEITLAFENYNTWGRYYLYSIYSAHEREWCNNFLDKGIQRYAVGKTFKSARDKMENAFTNLPVQKPTAIVHRSVPVARVVGSMGDTFYNTNSGCVGPNTKIVMNDGTYKSVKELKKGDMLAADTVVISVVKGPPVMMMKYAGIKITPYHPVLSTTNAKWQFPIDGLSQKVKFEMSASSWNLVTTSGCFYATELDVETITKVIALGHGIVDDDVAHHQYLGGEQVKVDVLRGYDETTGVCYIRGFKRDADTGLLCGVYI